MGFDLHPRNKEAGSFHFGAFSWTWMLDAGVGLVIGTGPADKPGTFTYRPDAKGRCPHYNDGFRVTGREARMMAAAARGLVSTQKAVIEAWSKLTPEQKVERERLRDIYKQPVREDFVEKVAAFADWAEKSRGFSVH